MPKRRRRQHDIEVEDRIAELMTDHAAPAIERELSRLKSAGELSGRVPSLRTIQRLMAQLQKRDPSGPWDPFTDETGNPRLVLDVINVLVERPSARSILVTRAEAALVVSIDRAAPGLPPFGLYRLAREYIARQAGGEGLGDLVMLLACAPWRDGDAGWERYSRLCKARGETVTWWKALMWRPDRSVDGAPVSNAVSSSI